MPSVASVWGLIFYSILAYIFSFTMSRLTGEFVARNIDVEEAVKRRIAE